MAIIVLEKKRDRTDIRNKAFGRKLLFKICKNYIRSIFQN